MVLEGVNHPVGSPGGCVPVHSGDVQPNQNSARALVGGLGCANDTQSYSSCQGAAFYRS